MVHKSVYFICVSKISNSIKRTPSLSSRRQKDKPYPKILKESGTQSKLHIYSLKCNLKKYLLSNASGRNFYKVISCISSFQCKCWFTNRTYKIEHASGKQNRQWFGKKLTWVLESLNLATATKICDESVQKLDTPCKVRDSVKERCACNPFTHLSATVKCNDFKRWNF